MDKMGCGFLRQNMISALFFGEKLLDACEQAVHCKRFADVVIHPEHFSIGSMSIALVCCHHDDPNWMVIFAA
jgi:hypothetical protein